MVIIECDGCKRQYAPTGTFEHDGYAEMLIDCPEGWTWTAVYIVLVDGHGSASPSFHAMTACSEACQGKAKANARREGLVFPNKEVVWRG